jgi:hypothetical protein
MNFIKYLIISIALGSMAMVSSTAFAGEDAGAKVRAAGEGTIVKIEEAITAIEKGGDKDAALNPLKEARQLQKEFRYEVTERQRQKGNNQLKAAREALDAGQMPAAEAALKEALAIFKEMKTIYDAAH